jgi:hypothetical protein
MAKGAKPAPAACKGGMTDLPHLVNLYIYQCFAGISLRCGVR